ncbi:MAG TPA: hypothetical protein VGF30_02500 [Bacteroidia bacterium]
MRALLIICLIGSNLLLKAGINPALEKAKADFKKVNQLYAATSSFSLDIQYAVFDNHVGGNLVEEKSGKYYKNKELSYTKMLNIETIVSAGKTVVVNNDDHVLVITDNRKVELSPIQTNMDTLLKLCTEIKMKDVGTTLRHYSLFFGSSSEFSQIDIDINLANYSIKKLVLFYNETLPLNQNDFYADEKRPRLEISYKAFNTTVAIDPSIFSESTYVTLVDNKYKGKGKYISYKVINQLQAARFKKK